MRQPTPKWTYRVEYDALMDGSVHLIECDTPQAAELKARALRTAAYTRHMTPTARILGTTVAFMATEPS